MSEMKSKYTEYFNEIVNSRVEGFTFCGMRGCIESPVAFDGIYVEATWGIIVHLENKKSIVFTWCEDNQLGDPFFACVSPIDAFMNIDSLALQDATSLIPWKNYVDQSVSNIAIHTYPTNYRNPEKWHDVT